MLTKIVKQKDILKESGKENINSWLKIHDILRGKNTKKKEIPKSWQLVRGILKNKKIPNPVKWQRKIRKEGEKRQEILHKIYKSK